MLEISSPITARRLVVPTRLQHIIRWRAFDIELAPRFALLAIVALAAVVRFANLEALGYANHYYAAAVKSMLQSWHNFFFVAAEPGGSVSVDKPPVGLWVQTISAYFFGVDGFGMLLPQIVAGILSVVMVYHLVGRWFGQAAGLLGALALAITPVVVATDRNNTMDSTLILVLLLAAWAFTKATESGKTRYLLMGAVLVGIGFNIKMLEAYLPLPAFVGLYFLGSRKRLWRKVANLVVAGIVLVAVSLSWAVVVDLVPANQRPFVGSSGDNSVMSLAVGYNGVQRLAGMGRGWRSILSGAGRGGGPAGAGQVGIPGRGGNPAGAGPAPSGGFVPPAQDGGGVPQPPRATADGTNRVAGPAGQRQGNRFGAGGGGMSGTGRAGVWRLFTTPLSKEASWLLPFGVFSALLLAVDARPRWPLSMKHQALVLWGGWLLAGGVFFSIAGFFHEYYLSILGAPLAALVAIGAIELWRLSERHSWLGVPLLLTLVGGTLAFQVHTAQAFVTSIWWLPWAIGLGVLGAAGLIVGPALLRRSIATAGLICTIAAMLVTPAIWSWLTVLNSSENQSLPAAYSGRPSGPANRGGLQVNEALLSYLQSHTEGNTYLMAVPSSMQGADYVLATGRPVLYLGGFMGQDRVETAEDLERMVASGELRYIYSEGGRGGFGGQTDATSWVASSCIAVDGFDTATRNSGAPDGTGTGGGPSAIRGAFGGDMRVSLYDCGGQNQ